VKSTKADVQISGHGLSCCWPVTSARYHTQLHWGAIQKLRHMREGLGTSMTVWQGGGGVHLSVTSQTKFYLQLFTILNNLSSCEYSATLYFSGNESHPCLPGIGKTVFFVLTVGPVGCFRVHLYWVAMVTATQPVECGSATVNDVTVQWVTWYNAVISYSCQISQTTVQSTPQGWWQV